MSMLARIIKGAITVTTPAGVAVAVSGGVTTIPLAPFLIAAGILGGAIVAVGYIKSRKHGQVKKLGRKNGDDNFYIQSFAGEYWSVAPTTGQLKCSSRNVQEQETFQVMQTEAGRYVFRAANDRYVSVDPTGTLIADQAAIDNAEAFTMEERNEPFVTFKTSGGTFVSRREDEDGLLKAGASEIREGELFRLMVMKDQIIITETVTVQQSLSVSIDILNYSEITKNHKGWFRGTFINVFYPTARKQEIRRKVMEDLGRELKPRIEGIINAELSARLGGEVAHKINLALAENKIEATVVANVVPSAK
jgi:hypothetical protein